MTLGIVLLQGPRRVVPQAPKAAPYLTQSVFQDVLQKSNPPQIRQDILCNTEGELTCAEKKSKNFA